MLRLLAACATLTIALAGCSSTPAQTTAPGATPGVVPTAPPAGQTTPPVGPTNAPAGGDVEALVRSLVPPGATETSELSVGNAYQLQLRSAMTLDQLEAFWTQAIPANGMTITGTFRSAGTMTIGIGNPDGGIVAAPIGDGTNGITISLGTST